MPKFHGNAAKVYLIFGQIVIYLNVSNSLSYISILRKKIQTKDKIEPQKIHRQITDNNVLFGFLNYFRLYGKEVGLEILETNLTRVE